METCENCGSVIGKLETPYIFNDSVVCSQCYQRLGSATAPPPVPAAAAPYLPRVLFHGEGTTVTASHISDKVRSLSVNEVVSFKSVNGWWSLGTSVHIYDVLKYCHKFIFSDSANARKFIVAVRQANPAIVAAASDDWFFFLEV